MKNFNFAGIKRTPIEALSVLGQNFMDCSARLKSRAKKDLFGGDIVKSEVEASVKRDLLTYRKLLDKVIESL